MAESSAPATHVGPTVVLVHGAYADASGWASVIGELLSRGVSVLAPANPLRGLDYDAAYLGSVLDTVAGAIVLVAHSYGGVVITNAGTGRPNVRALVYIAGFAPDEGESVFSLSSRAPGSQIVPPGQPGATLIPRPYPLPDGGTGTDTYIDPARFHEIFAADVPAATAAAMGAAQRPAEAGGLLQLSGVPAWKTVPAWALVPTADRVIGTDNLRFMAQRAGATSVEVDASHAVHVSQPAAVTALILQALDATAG